MSSNNIPQLVSDALSQQIKEGGGLNYVKIPSTVEDNRGLTVNNQRNECHSPPRPNAFVKEFQNQDPKTIEMNAFINQMNRLYCVKYKSPEFEKEISALVDIVVRNRAIVSSDQFVTSLLSTYRKSPHVNLSKELIMLQACMDIFTHPSLQGVSFAENTHNLFQQALNESLENEKGPYKHAELRRIQDKYKTSNSGKNNPGSFLNDHDPRVRKYGPVPSTNTSNMISLTGPTAAIVTKPPLAQNPTLAKKPMTSPALNTSSVLSSFSKAVEELLVGEPGLVIMRMRIERVAQLFVMATTNIEKSKCIFKLLTMTQYPGYGVLGKLQLWTLYKVLRACPTFRLAYTEASMLDALFKRLLTHTKKKENMDELLALRFYLSKVLPQHQFTQIDKCGDDRYQSLWPRKPREPKISVDDFLAEYERQQSKSVKAPKSGNLNNRSVALPKYDLRTKTVPSQGTNPNYVPIGKSRSTYANFVRGLNPDVPIAPSRELQFSNWDSVREGNRQIANTNWPARTAPVRPPPVPQRTVVLSRNVIPNSGHTSPPLVVDSSNLTPTEIYPDDITEISGLFSPVPSEESDCSDSDIPKVPFQYVPPLDMGAFLKSCREDLIKLSSQKMDAKKQKEDKTGSSSLTPTKNTPSQTEMSTTPPPPENKKKRTSLVESTPDSSNKKSRRTEEIEIICQRTVKETKANPSSESSKPALTLPAVRSVSFNPSTWTPSCMPDKSSIVPQDDKPKPSSIPKPSKVIEAIKAKLSRTQVTIRRPSNSGTREVLLPLNFTAQEFVEQWFAPSFKEMGTRLSNGKYHCYFIHDIPSLNSPRRPNPPN